MPWRAAGDARGRGAPPTFLGLATIWSWRVGARAAPGHGSVGGLAQASEARGRAGGLLRAGRLGAGGAAAHAIKLLLVERQRPTRRLRRLRRLRRHQLLVKRVVSFTCWGYGRAGLERVGTGSAGRGWLRRTLSTAFAACSGERSGKPMSTKTRRAAVAARAVYIRNK